MLLAPQSHPETTARLEALSRGGEAEAAFRPLQVVGRDRNGASIPLALTLARIGPSEAPQFCALVRDLSRERETERRLIAAREAAEAASAAKTDFLAQVSHEIRTPLHAILGFAEVMLEERFGPVGNERYKDYLKDIHASGSHVMSLADDLLDLSKIEAGKLELAFASVDANSVIRECVSLMQPQAARERVIMRVSLHDRLPRVMVDERSLKQIMLNLMSNAVKFNEPGGQVIVSTAIDAAGQAVIRVRDTGVGMNENEVGLALDAVQPGRQGRGQGRGRSRPAADQGAGRSQQGRIFDQEPARAGHADRDRLPQHPGGAVGGVSAPGSVAGGQLRSQSRARKAVAPEGIAPRWLAAILPARPNVFSDLGPRLVPPSKIARLALARPGADDAFALVVGFHQCYH